MSEQLATLPNPVEPDLPDEARFGLDAQTNSYTGAVRLEEFDDMPDLDPIDFAEGDPDQPNDDIGSVAVAVTVTPRRTKHILYGKANNPANPAENAPHTTMNEHIQKQELQGFAHVEGWFNPEHILDLQDSINTEVSKQSQEAHLLGDNYQLGFDKPTLQSEVTQRHLEKYFGATEEELKDGKTIPLWAQQKVASFLAMPQAQLEQLNKSLEGQAVQDRQKIKTYISGLDKAELAQRNKELAEEIDFVLGENKSELSPPVVQAITLITEKRGAEAYFMHEIEKSSEQKLHRFVKQSKPAKTPTTPNSTNPAKPIKPIKTTIIEKTGYDRVSGQVAKLTPLRVEQKKNQ